MQTTPTKDAYEVMRNAYMKCILSVHTRFFCYFYITGRGQNQSTVTLLNLLENILSCVGTAR